MISRPFFSASLPTDCRKMDEQTHSPAEIWQAAYGELQLQIPREAFNTWLRHARLVAHEDGTYIIGVANIYAREWLEHRLKKVIARTLARIAGRSVEVRFIVAPEHKQTADLYDAGPLLADLAQAQAEEPHFERLPPGETGLNPRQTFATYAVGACNRLALTAAQAAVEAPAAQFNPLYFYGGVGVGKSHLLHAIGKACVQRGLRVLYATAETFTNDLLAALRLHSTDQFRAKYRNVDVLLLDDVEFLAGKDVTQEEFYHTFNALVSAEAQIVVAARRPPAEIKGLDRRLRSRFEGGLVAEIKPPDFLTRVDILEIKAHLRGLGDRIPLDLLERIAEEFDGSVRELEGALNRIVAASLLTQEPPSLEAAEAILGPYRPSGEPQPTLEDILMAVAEYYGVTPADLMGRGRSREVSVARQVAMYIAHEEANIPLQEIGEALGGRSHSTVLYSCERIGDLMRTDSRVRREVRAILQILLPHSAPEDRPPHRSRS